MPEPLVQRVAAGPSLNPGLRLALQTLATAGRSSEAFHRRRVAYWKPVCVLWGERDAVVPTLAGTCGSCLIEALPRVLDVNAKSLTG
jgi:hypothetical protein